MVIWAGSTRRTYIRVIDSVAVAIFAGKCIIMVIATYSYNIVMDIGSTFTHSNVYVYVL